MTTYFIKALGKLRPDAAWHLTGDSYAGLVWQDTEQTKPTEAELTAECDRLQTEHGAKQYQRDRATAYPSIQEQLDLLYWDKVNGTDNWEQSIAAVKAAHPKG
jgi:hypothetical protein